MSELDEKLTEALTLAGLDAKTRRWLKRQDNKRNATNPKTKSYERTEDEPVAITPVEYGGLQEGFDHFNRELFSGKLPDVFITYQRKAGMAGHFAADRYSGRIGKFGKHELALNPDAFINQTDKQICQTLVHEMMHVHSASHQRAAITTRNGPRR